MNGSASWPQPSRARWPGHPCASALIQGDLTLAAWGTSANPHEPTQGAASVKSSLTHKPSVTPALCSQVTESIRRLHGLTKWGIWQSSVQRDGHFRTQEAGGLVKVVHTSLSPLTCHSQANVKTILAAIWPRVGMTNHPDVPSPSVGAAQLPRGTISWMFSVAYLVPLDSWRKSRPQPFFQEWATAMFSHFASGQQSASLCQAVCQDPGQ